MSDAVDLLDALTRQRNELNVQIASVVAAKEQAARTARQNVSIKLAQYKLDIEKLVKEAEELAKTADLVFYYSSGYEEFNWENKENWSESSKHC